MNHFDLAVIGTGSGNTIVGAEFADQSVVMIERGVFGGTCINVGCVPTKMFVYPADLARHARRGPSLGVDTTVGAVRWGDLRDRVFARIDPISVEGRDYRATRNQYVTLLEGTARFTAPRTLSVETSTGREQLTADQVVIAAGSRATVPDIPGLTEVKHHTSDTIMRLAELPDRLGIIGGGFVAAEFAHVFSAFGSSVTQIHRGSSLLRDEDDDVAARFTEIAGRQWNLLLDSVVDRVEATPGGIAIHLGDDRVEVDALLVATGRVPNSDLLDLPAAGVATDPLGVIVVDEFMRTTAPGVWALGDIAGHFQLKHVANQQARVVRHNLRHPDDLRAADNEVIPSAVFTYPQIASFGLKEREAVLRGVRHVVARQAYSEVAYGWAMEDTEGFVKVLADPDTGLLLGAHIIGDQASNLIQPLVQAATFGQTAYDVARGQYWIHPALAEVVENALLGLDLTQRG